MQYVENVHFITLGAGFGYHICKMHIISIFSQPTPNQLPPNSHPCPTMVGDGRVEVGWGSGVFDILTLFGWRSDRGRERGYQQAVEKYFIIIRKKCVPLHSQ